VLFGAGGADSNIVEKIIGRAAEAYRDTTH